MNTTRGVQAMVHGAAAPGRDTRRQCTTDEGFPRGAVLSEEELAGHVMELEIANCLLPSTITHVHRSAPRQHWQYRPPKAAPAETAGEGSGYGRLCPRDQHDSERRSVSRLEKE